MITVVTFVSLMVHIYTIGYMADDPGYTRFFSYISLFTFSMLMLVMANNFLQLFFGWEAVGLVSYLLIGFWYTRPTAIYANLKAFLATASATSASRSGSGSSSRTPARSTTPRCSAVRRLSPARRQPGRAIANVGPHRDLHRAVRRGDGQVGAGAAACVLPDSMEGPTPISALIHAATMVTAGIFMVARMSPLFEFSEVALSFVTIIGATTALFMALLGVVQTDIKRVVPTRPFRSSIHDRRARRVGVPGGDLPSDDARILKALLFLAAGSVIIALHHEQDLRKMGGLRKYMRSPTGQRSSARWPSAACRHSPVLLQERSSRRPRYRPCPATPTHSSQ